ncbi:MAG: hypothetical protein K2Q12_08665 [Rickettsiales bacterium]|nr:hypothetical protein [Rickettsiales bacterium]
MDDITLGVEMQFNFSFFNQGIKNRILLKAALNPVHLVGDNCDGLFLFFCKLNNLQELLTMADRRRFDNLECFQHPQIFSFAIFLQPMDLRVDGITFFLLPGRNSREYHRAYGFSHVDLPLLPAKAGGRGVRKTVLRRFALVFRQALDITNASPTIGRSGILHRKRSMSPLNIGVTTPQNCYQFHLR